MKTLSTPASPFAEYAEATSIMPPPLGQPWPEQGGAYLGICRGEPGQPDQHLILITDPAAAIKGIWGKYHQDVAGAKSRFDGRANTIAMAAAGCDIAQRVLELEVGGHKDLFIGSQAQMQLACASAPELFENNYHWSSTQYSSNGAFVQGFEGGGSGWSSKVSEHRVRAFRAIPLQPLITSALSA